MDDDNVVVAEEAPVEVEIPSEFLEGMKPNDQPLIQNNQPTGDDDDDDDAVEPVAGETQDQLRERRRAKRKARKEYHRRQQAEKDQKLTQLEKANQELLARLSRVETATIQNEKQQISGAIQEHAMRVQQAEAAMAEATKNGDGDLMLQAQRQYHESRRAVDELTALKTQFEREAVPQPQAPQAAQGPNPRVKQLRDNWLAQNGSWYKPGSADEDSAIAFAIDQTIAREGYKPDTEEYWGELDRRLRNRLPHRYENRQQQSPRSAVTGSGREVAPQGGSGSKITLSAERVRALKDAGMWDDKAKRDKAIASYLKYDRERGG